MDEKKIIVNLDDTKYQTYSTPANDKRLKWEIPDDKVFKSIIPGTVVEVFVKEGDKVEEGDRMLIIEAMKMNNEFAFHRSGTVKAVHVKTSDIVAKGKILLELE